MKSVTRFISFHIMFFHIIIPDIMTPPTIASHINTAHLITAHFTTCTGILWLRCRVLLERRFISCNGISHIYRKMAYWGGWCSTISWDVFNCWSTFSSVPTLPNDNLHTYCTVLYCKRQSQCCTISVCGLSFIGVGPELKVDQLLNTILDMCGEVPSIPFMFHEYLQNCCYA